MSGYSNAQQLFDEAIARLTGETGIFDSAVRPSAGEATVIVYNGLSWTRGGPVGVERIPAALREGPLQVVDRAAGEVRPCEDLPGTARRVLFVAPQIPSMGYRVFTTHKGARPETPKTEYGAAVEVDTEGWIRSTRSGTGAEFVWNNNQRIFGALLYASRNSAYEVVPVAIAKRRPRMGLSAGASRSPATTLRSCVRSRRPTATVCRSVGAGNLRSLADRSGRIAVAFPLDISEQLWLGGAGFVYRVPQDHLPGSAKSGRPNLTIATRDSALLLRHGSFLLASQGLRTETRDEGTQQLERTEPRGSEIQTFRFRLVMQAPGIAEWKRFDQELSLPLRASVIGEADLSAEQSFLWTNNPKIVITAFKAAEDHPGWFVLRLQEI